MLAFQILFALALVSPEAVLEAARKDGANDIRIYRVQLDTDSALEVVLQFIIPSQGVIGRVLDQDGGGWQVVGKFNSWWRFEAADAESFLEFRETVTPGVKDVIVRHRGGGTEISGTTLDIYRLRNGVLELVLSVMEQETAMEHPSGDVFETNAQIAYMPGRIKTVALRRPGNRKTCISYVWSAARFRFEDDPSTDNSACR